MQNIYTQVVSSGTNLWIKYDPTPGQSQCGDYGYLNAYAKERIEAVVNGEIFVKGRVKDITWNYNGIQFNILILGSMKNGVPEKLYTVFIKEPERLFLSL